MITVDTLTRVMWYSSGLILLAGIVLIALAIMGPLQGPATMPVPPSGANYSATN